MKFITIYTIFVNAPFPSTTMIENNALIYLYHVHFYMELANNNFLC